MLTTPSEACSKSVLARQLDGRCERVSLRRRSSVMPMCHLYTFSRQCFSPGVTEMPTIPVSTILPLPVILPFFSSLVVFLSSFSQFSIFLGSLSQDYTTMLYGKQSLNTDSSERTPRREVTHR